MIPLRLFTTLLLVVLFLLASSAERPYAAAAEMLYNALGIPDSAKGISSVDADLCQKHGPIWHVVINAALLTPGSPLSVSGCDLVSIRVENKMPSGTSISITDNKLGILWFYQSGSSDGFGVAGPDAKITVAGNVFRIRSTSEANITYASALVFYDIVIKKPRTEIRFECNHFIRPSTFNVDYEASISSIRMDTFDFWSEGGLLLIDNNTFDVECVGCGGAYGINLRGDLSGQSKISVSNNRLNYLGTGSLRELILFSGAFATFNRMGSLRFDGNEAIMHTVPRNKSFSAGAGMIGVVSLTGLKRPWDNYVMMWGNSSFWSICGNKLVSRGYKNKVIVAFYAEVRIPIVLNNKFWNVFIDRFYFGYISELRLEHNSVRMAIDPATGDFFGGGIVATHAVEFYLMIAFVNITRMLVRFNYCNTGLYTTTGRVVHFSTQHPVTVILFLEVAYNVLESQVVTIAQLDKAGMNRRRLDIFVDSMEEPYEDIVAVHWYYDGKPSTSDLAVSFPALQPSNFLIYPPGIVRIHSNSYVGSSFMFIRVIACLHWNITHVIGRYEMYNNSIDSTLRIVHKAWYAQSALTECIGTQLSMQPGAPIYELFVHNNSMRVGYEFYEGQGVFNAKVVILVQVVIGHPEFVYNITVSDNTMVVRSWPPVINIMGSVSGVDILRNVRYDYDPIGPKFVPLPGHGPRRITVERNNIFISNVPACPPTSCSAVTLRHVDGDVGEFPMFILRSNNIVLDNIGSEINKNSIAVISFTSFNPTPLRGPEFLPSGITMFTIDPILTYHHGPIIIEGNEILFTRIRPGLSTAPFVLSPSTLMKFVRYCDESSTDIDYDPFVLRNNNITFELEPNEQQKRSKKIESAQSFFLFSELLSNVELTPAGDDVEQHINMTIAGARNLPEVVDFSGGKIVIENCTIRAVGIRFFLGTGIQVSGLGGVEILNSTINFVGDPASLSDGPFSFFSPIRRNAIIFGITQFQPQGVFRHWNNFELSIAQNSTLRYSILLASKPSSFSALITLFRSNFDPLSSASASPSSSSSSKRLSFRISGDSRVESVSSTSLVEFGTNFYPDGTELFGALYALPGPKPQFPAEFLATQFSFSVDSGATLVLSGDTGQPSSVGEASAAEAAALVRGAPPFGVNVSLVGARVEVSAAETNDQMVLVSMLKQQGGGDASSSSSSAAAAAGTVDASFPPTQFILNRASISTPLSSFHRVLHIPSGSEPERRGDRLPVPLSARCVRWNGVLKSKHSGWLAGSAVAAAAAGDAAAAVDFSYSKCPGRDGKISQTLSIPETVSVVPECAPFSLVYLGAKLRLRDLLYQRSLSFTVGITPRAQRSDIQTMPPAGLRQSQQWTTFRSSLRWPMSSVEEQERLDLYAPLLAVKSSSTGGRFKINATYVSDQAALRVDAALVDTTSALEGDSASYSVTLRLNRGALACRPPDGRDEGEFPAAEDLVINFARSSPEEVSTQLLAFSETSGRIALIMSAGMAGGAVAKNMARSLMLGRYVDCVLDLAEYPLPFELSPLGLAVGNERAQYLRGAVVGNGLVLGFFCGTLCLLTAWWLLSRDRKRKEALRVESQRRNNQQSSSGGDDEFGSPLLMRHRSTVSFRRRSSSAGNNDDDDEYSGRGGGGGARRRKHSSSVRFDPFDGRRIDDGDGGSSSDEDDAIYDVGDARSRERQDRRTVRRRRKEREKKMEKKRHKSLLTITQFKRSLFSVGFVEICINCSVILLTGSVSSAVALMVYGPPESRFVDVAMSVLCLLIAGAIGVWHIWVTAVELPKRPRVIFFHNQRKTGGGGTADLQQRQLAEDSDSPDETEIMKFVLHVSSHDCEDCRQEREQKRSAKRQVQQEMKLERRKSSVAGSMLLRKESSGLSDGGAAAAASSSPSSSSVMKVHRPLLPRKTPLQRVMPYIEDFFMYTGMWKVAQVPLSRSQEENNNNNTSSSNNKDGTLKSLFGGSGRKGSDHRFIARCGECFRDVGDWAPAYLSSDYLLLYVMAAIQGVMPAARSGACMSMGIVLSLLNVVPFVAVIAYRPFRHWITNVYAFTATLAITVQCLALLATYLVGDADISWLMVTSTVMQLVLQLSSSFKATLDIAMVWFDSDALFALVARRIRHHILHGRYSPFNKRAWVQWERDRSAAKEEERRRKEQEKKNDAVRAARRRENRNTLVQLVEDASESNDIDEEMMSRAASRAPVLNLASRRSKSKCWDI